MEPHDVAMVVGVRGFGKTYCATHGFILPHKGRVIAWDPLNSRDSFPLERVTLDEFLDMDPEDKGLRVAVRPDPTQWDDINGEFCDFIDCVAKMRDAMLVVDEIGFFEYNARRKLEKFTVVSRHYRIPVLLVAQRATQIPVTAREQATVIVSYWQNRPEDIKALAERMGPAAENISKLKRFKAIAWTQEGGTQKRKPQE
jgi:hypothetical protein